MTAVVIMAAVVIVGLIGHAIVCLAFARSDEGQTQARGHKLGYW